MQQPLQIINKLLNSFNTSVQTQSTLDDDSSNESNDYNIINEYQQKIKQIQEHKQKIAVKISKSDLNTEAKNLLQQQASYFEIEMQLFHKLYGQLNELITLNQQLMKENNQIKTENNTFKHAQKHQNRNIKPSIQHNAISTKTNNMNTASIHQQLLHLSQDNNTDANPSYLLSQGANPNIIDPYYHKWTPLHYSVFLNKENFALQLLKHPKTNAKLLDSDGFSALYWASKKSTPKVIKALLSMGCDPNKRDMHGMTPLFAAVASNKKENVEALLSHPNVNINQPNQFGGSVLHHTAFATDNIEIADMLVKAGGDLFLFDYDNKAPLHVALERKKENLFKYYKSKMEEYDPNWKCNVSLEMISDEMELNGNRWDFTW